MAEDINPDDLEIADELIAERRSGSPEDLPANMSPGKSFAWMIGIIMGLLSGGFLGLVLSDIYEPATGWMIGMGVGMAMGLITGWLMGGPARATCIKLDIFSVWVGRIVCWLTIPMMFAIVYEVIVRKAGYPTMWAYDITRFLYGALFMLGAGYALFRGVHIRADFIYRNWSPRTQGIVDTTLYLLFYFPGMLAFLWISTEYASEAWMRGERGMDTAWMPHLGPIRTALPLGVLFLLLQGISELIKSVYATRNGEWP